MTNVAHIQIIQIDMYEYVDVGCNVFIVRCAIFDCFVATFFLYVIKIVWMGPLVSYMKFPIFLI